MIRRLKAFTLVELLVVIGIIAVLIGILLPTLGKVREAAQRTACLSNIRELGNALRQYSLMWKDVVPIGYMSQKQFSYAVFWNNGNPTPKITQMGFLSVAGLMSGSERIPYSKIYVSPTAIPQSATGSPYYCPTVTDPMFTRDTPQNPFPFDPAIGGQKHTRVSYMSRPVVDWPAGTGTDDPATWFPSTTVGSTKIITLPKLSKLKSKALVADLFRCKYDVQRRHKSGINVYYGNGSARWVPVKVLQQPLKVLSTTYNWNNIADEPSAVLTSWNDFFLYTPPANVKLPEQGLWVELDKQ